MVERIEIPYGNPVFQDHAPGEKNTVQLKISKTYLPRDDDISYSSSYQRDFSYDRQHDRPAIIKVRMRFGVA
jgi:hypothetical protein